MFRDGAGREVALEQMAGDCLAHGAWCNGISSRGARWPRCARTVRRETRLRTVFDSLLE